MSEAEYDEAVARGERLDEDAVFIVEPLGDTLIGHDDGLADDGVRRLRRPSAWSQSIDASGVETTVFVLAEVAPAIGAEVDIDGLRYRVLNVTLRRDISDPTGLGARAFDLDVDQVGPSPHDPLVPRAREIIERHGATVERLSATREGSWRYVTIHAVASWPGRTIDVYGSGPNDHAALDDLDQHLEHFTP